LTNKIKTYRLRSVTESRYECQLCTNQKVILSPSF
jgi:hypothetical protein